MKELTRAKQEMRDARRRFYLAVFALLGTSHAYSPSRPYPPAGPASHESCAVSEVPSKACILLLETYTSAQIDPKAIVSDACASFSTLDRLNADLLPSIKSLTHSSDFFSYYRLNLYNKECPFWDDANSMCGNRACAVDTIDNEDDIPPIWRTEELGRLEGPKASHPSRHTQRERTQKPLQGKLGADVGESCVVEYDDECDERDYCVPEDEGAASKGDYVSLVDNPERFTGYSGPGANMVWEAIYRENCFSSGIATSGSSIPHNAALFGSSASTPNKLQEQAALDLRHVIQDRDAGDDNTDECLEKRVFYRVISGMHASISTHLCYDYLNQTTGQWGPNLHCYESRLHDYPDRISNLYFNYALVLRAIAKVRPALKTYTFCSGDPSQDALTKSKILALADQIASGPQIYDESLMFADTNAAPSAVPLKEDFRNRFRNVSRTMDCVGCDKCRLWGKLQTAGYGTALKILFEFDDRESSQNPPLRRTELVALVNTLDKLSGALSALGAFEGMLEHVPAASDQEAGMRGSVDPVLGVSADTGTSAAVEDVETEDVDDGFSEYVLPADPRDTESVWGGLKREFNQEFGLVFRTTVWVFQRWFALPRELFELFVVQASRLWDAWLGISSTTGVEVKRFVGWQVQQPPRREEL